MVIYKIWIPPVLKQCFVSCGAALSTGAAGLVMGYGVPLLGQLSHPHSHIPIDQDLGSWLASLPTIFLFIGNLLVTPAMEYCGRRTANLICICCLIVAWICIVFSSDIVLLLVGRALQGVSMGMSTALGAIIIGECCSPRHRGVLLMSISVMMTLGVLVVHAVGSLFTWRTSAVICAVIAAVDLAIVLLSPETPTWLASRGKYEESTTVFRWLRGDKEEQELTKIIESAKFVREATVNKEQSKIVPEYWKDQLVYFSTSVRKKEFYKPIIITFHIYFISCCSGVNFVTAYAESFIQGIVGNEDVNMPLCIFTLDVNRLLTNILAVFIIKKTKRRLMLFWTVSANIAALLAISAYTYARANYVLHFDHPMIGISLSHILIFTTILGPLPFSFIIPGEIFPLEFKSVAGSVSVLLYSVTFFVTLKSVPYCFVLFGVSGTCVVYGGVLVYCALVAGLMLPETKDRTLQDIEQHFRRETVPVDGSGEQTNIQV